MTYEFFYDCPLCDTDESIMVTCEHDAGDWFIDIYPDCDCVLPGEVEYDFYVRAEAEARDNYISHIEWLHDEAIDRKMDGGAG